MSQNLVIVESPAKAKTIEKFLGKDYRVMSSYGHIRDLKKKSFGIDIDNDFSPVYEIPADKQSLVNELRKAAQGAQTVWLASDEDREGEAIAWHLYEVLGLKPDNTQRIVFHEITKSAILNAIANPRSIDLHRVDAQQARRVLDRIVGFELSPVLWRKLKPALSAGRVQSVAVRLIVERENEINNFVSEPYFRVTAIFDTGNGSVRAELSHRLPTLEAARDFLSECSRDTFRVDEITVKPLFKSPAPPFTTSTLQQEAARKLGFSVSQTMMVAQRLYESGHITYMRTDSVNLSKEAIAAISSEITETMGKEYLHVRHYHTSSKGAQEAHEAIRPTYISEKDPSDLTAQEKRLYHLIRTRAIASQMADAKIEKTTVNIRPSGRPAEFVALGEVIDFDGFLRVYIEGRDDDNASEDTNRLPQLHKGQTVDAVEITATERFTQQPPRYTEASLVKKMEDLGIGRPSTYAPTISTIQQREYVARGEKPGTPRDYSILTVKPGNDVEEKTATENVGSEKAKLIPTDIGIIVNDFLTQHFPDILDYNFTAKIEEKFDEIAQGERKWDSEIKDFYTLFHPEVTKALEEHEETKFGSRMLGVHPETGEPVVVKIGRFGPMVQIGEPDAEVKPRFASLLKGQSLMTITLEEALDLFNYPRHLGKYEDYEVTVAIGRFGPYVAHHGKFASIPKDIEPGEVTLEYAIQLIEEKRQQEKNRLVKQFKENEKTQILNGRYGVYISHEGKNYKIPKALSDPAGLTYEEVMVLVADQDAKGPAKRRTTRKKS